MSLDGILMYKLALELNYLSTGKIDKIQEVSDDEFLLTIRRDRQNYKLLISLTPNYPRINLTENTFSFPREPKSFTMLLRKHFEGSIIDSIKTHETDRIIVIETSRYNELGDFERTELIVEIMGRYSNLVIVNNNYIIDALRHIGVSELRTILPNGKYEFPDTLGKINPFNYSLEELRDELKFIQTPK
jgi:predicted ribosome quality control (RQC) complex YloA/Tae2 family protein